jgi:hypothetical protein
MLNEYNLIRISEYSTYFLLQIFYQLPERDAVIMNMKARGLSEIHNKIISLHGLRTQGHLGLNYTRSEGLKK